MARPIKYDWVVIRKALECGKSNEYVNKKYDVPFDTINKHLKRNPLTVNQQAKSIVEDLDKVSQVVSQVADKRPDLAREALIIAGERSKHIIYFTNSILVNQEFANKKIDENTELVDLNIHSQLTNRNKDGILGKEPSNVVTVNTQTSIQNNNISIEWE